MGETLGKVTLYYVAHVGRGVLRNRAFKKAFGKADVIDLESASGATPGDIRTINDIARGDESAFAKQLMKTRANYAETGGQELLFDEDLLRLLYRSGKRVVFENPPKKPQRYYEKIYGFFPGLRNARVPPEPRISNIDGVFGRVFEHITLARSMHDGNRLAVSLMKEPGKSRLVIRGMNHAPTTMFLKDALERRGTRAAVDEIVMPFAKTRAIGTPVQVMPRIAMAQKMRRGIPLSEMDLLKEDAMHHFTGMLIGKGWRTPDALSRAAFLSNALGRDALKRIKENPVWVETVKRDAFKPWWKLGKKATPSRRRA